MKTDMEKARERLAAGGFTCVLCRGESFITATADGISPMLDLLADGVDLRGYSAADKIVGKAVAMLFRLAGVAAVYGEVVSENAVAFCGTQGLELAFGTCVPYIVNRMGTGCCPMEETVKDIDDIQEAHRALRRKRDELRARRKAQQAR